MSVIAGQVAGKTVAPFVFGGSTDKAVFETWAGKFPVLELPEGCTIILDNASFSEYSDVETIATEKGHSVLWLPTNSPDLNPIEHYWAKLKKAHRWICTEIGWLDGKSVDWAFKYAHALYANAVLIHTDIKE